MTKIAALQTAQVPKKKRGRGRPPKGARAMTGAERTALYREHKSDDQVLERMEHLGRVNLLDMLAGDLRLLDKYKVGKGAPADLLPDLIEGGQITAGRIVGEIVRRYELVLPRRKSTAGR